MNFTDDQLMAVSTAGNLIGCVFLDDDRHLSPGALNDYGFLDYKGDNTDLFDAYQKLIRRGLVDVQELFKVANDFEKINQLFEKFDLNIKIV